MNDLNVTPRPSLLTELLEEAKLDPASDTTVRGLSSLLTELLRAPGEGASQRLAKSKVDALIEDIDKRLTAQVNAILHTPEVKGLETAWRGAKYLVDAVDFRENIRLELVNATKVDLLTDFRDAPEITHTGLYRTLYKSAFGVFGGRPYGVICSTHDFGPGADDVELLRGCAAIAAMSHAPFITNTNPDMFGKGSFAEIPQLKDLQATFESPRYARWNAFRDSEDARYVGLCMPRFLLRAPYGGRESEIRVRDFDFSEEVIDQHERYLWGPASIALTAKIAESFAAHRWCPNIIGPQGGGAVFNLPLHQYHQGRRAQDQEPLRGGDRRPQGVRAGRAGLHRPNPAQRQQQRRLLLGQLGPAPQGLRAHPGGPGRPGQPHPRHPPALHVRDHPPRALPQGAPARTDRQF
jgi:type VI secretion system protein ImpC